MTEKKQTYPEHRRCFIEAKCVSRVSEDVNLIGGLENNLIKKNDFVAYIMRLMYFFSFFEIFFFYQNET